MGDLTPTPIALWKRADSEHPGDAAARILRYRELMVEAGYLVPKEAPDA